MEDSLAASGGPGSHLLHNHRGNKVSFDGGTDGGQTTASVKCVVETVMRLLASLPTEVGFQKEPRASLIKVVSAAWATPWTIRPISRLHWSEQRLSILLKRTWTVQVQLFKSAIFPKSKKGWDILLYWRIFVPFGRCAVCIPLLDYMVMCLAAN